MIIRKEGIDSMARANAARDIRAAPPGIWTRSWTEELLAPKTACIPVQPSLPIVAISMMLPSASTATTETTPLSGKNTWSSELSAFIRTCPRWQGMRSSSGISRLRLRDGRASKSRLRGQFDNAFIPSNRARFASFPDKTSCDAHSTVFPDNWLSNLIQTRSAVGASVHRRRPRFFPREGNQHVHAAAITRQGRPCRPLDVVLRGMRADHENCNGDARPGGNRNAHLRMRVRLQRNS